MNSVIYYTEDKLLPSAQMLSEFTNCCILFNHEPIDVPLYLRMDAKGLAIVSSEFKPLYVSEIYAKLVSRYRNLKDELLVQIVKDKLKSGAQIWDLTAGLGKDAFILASAGYNVTMVEQNPLLATILHYALHNNIIPSSNLHLVYANSVDFLAVTTNRPDIIYLDPMFNKDAATSKAKKEMQLIQMLTDNDVISDDIELFNLSYPKVSSHIIVKRDNKQANLVTTPLPTYTKSGKTIRFDIYSVSNA